MDKRVPSGGDEGHIRDSLLKIHEAIGHAVTMQLAGDGPDWEIAHVDYIAAMAEAKAEIDAIRVRGDKAREAKGEPDIVQVTTKRFDLTRKGGTR